MILFYEIIMIFLSAIVLIKLKKITEHFYCISPIIVVFDLVMVLPIILEIFLGIPNAPYMNFRRALKDTTTLYIYITFVIAMQFCFLHEINRIRRKNKNNVKEGNILSYFENSKHKTLIKLFCIIIFIATIIAVFLSPDPSFYFKINSVHYIMSESISSYHYGVMRTFTLLCFASVIILKLIDKDDKFKDLLLRAAFILLILFLNQKRTLLLMLVGICFIIDLVKKKNNKKLIKKYIVVFILTAAYFYYYTIITDKISYNDDWYYELNEYIFRSMHVRFAIYAVLNPQKIHILDYSGQTIIFNLLYFIPRSVWSSKPLPYATYYMMGLLNLKTPRFVTFEMPASYYTEFISNFGLYGILASMLFTVFISRYFDKQKGLCKILGVSLITLLEIYYYNDLLKVVALILLILILSNKIKLKDKKIYFGRTNTLNSIPKVKERR